MLYLTELADWLRAHGRNRFLFTGLPHQWQQSDMLATALPVGAFDYLRASASDTRN
jgi:hypothetical protein